MGHKYTLTYLPLEEQKKSKKFKSLNSALRYSFKLMERKSIIPVEIFKNETPIIELTEIIQRYKSKDSLWHVWLTKLREILLGKTIAP